VVTIKQPSGLAGKSGVNTVSKLTGKPVPAGPYLAPAIFQIPAPVLEGDSDGC